MVRITKRGITEELNGRILDDFLKKIKRIENTKELGAFLSEFLTADEQIAVKKRLGIAILLQEGKRKKHISEILDVSRTTINSVQKEGKTRKQN